MYQQGRRLGEMNARGGSFRELATLQCQSYLAATNALSLVKKEHAWVAVVSGDESERVRLPFRPSSLISG
jgi:nuclear pore complex protein Nup160